MLGRGRGRGGSVYSAPRVAKAVYEWLAHGEGGHGESPSWFRNQPGQEMTVRVDSKVVEDLEQGGTSADPA